MSQLNTITRKTLLSAFYLSSTALILTGQAYAQDLRQNTPSSPINYAMPLSNVTASSDKTDSAVLDWRMPTASFNFSLPESNLNDKIELLISADPRGSVNPKAPLSVQFNNDEPVLLNVNGQGFDARITFDPNKARSSHNVVKVNFGPQSEAGCLSAQDGIWDINLSQSKLVINSRPRARGLQLREIETLLKTPGLAPQTVSLTAAGNNTVQLESLAAQGIGLRMKTIPDFTTERRSSGFEIIMARRAELSRYISDDSLINGRGPAIIIPRERPVKLVFTGDTDAQVLALVKSFAQRSLPKARRSITSLGETRLQTPFKSNLVRLSGSQTLAGIPGAASFTNWRGDDWASQPKSLRFDVTDPNAMSGELILRLASSKNISDTSKFTVQLNDQNIGSTVLDKRRKTVGFKIKAGTLRGKDNVLSLLPHIEPSQSGSCQLPIGPNFHLGSGSKIVLKTDIASPITELSRMGATAVPFADAKGTQSYIAMTGTTVEYNASLKVLARLAKTSGEGLVAAQYSRSVNPDINTPHHLLYIGPSNQLPSGVLKNAPQALISALRGQVFEDENLISANIEQFANLDSQSAFQSAARSISQSNRIRRGGVAALYPSHLSSAHIIGVITNAPGQNYSASTNLISQDTYWSKIKGGVARWNENTVLTAQAPQAVSGYKLLKQDKMSEPIFGQSNSMLDDAINAASTLSTKVWDNLKRFAVNLPLGQTSDDTAAKPSSVTVKPQDKTENWITHAQEGLSRANKWASKTGQNIGRTIQSWTNRNTPKTQNNSEPET